MKAESTLSCIFASVSRFALVMSATVASGVLATIVSQDPIYAVFPVSQRQLQEIRESRQQQDGRVDRLARDGVRRLPAEGEVVRGGRRDVGRA
jgi:hypothetical protein